MAAPAPKENARSAKLQAVPVNDEEPGEDGVPPKKSRKKLVWILLILLLLGGGGAGAWYFLKPGHAKTPEAAAEGEANAAAPAAAEEKKLDPSKPPVFVVLEPFTVNLQPESGNDQFLQVSLTLQVVEQAQAEAVKLYMPQVRSVLLLLLSSKHASEISTVEGKKKLSESVVAQLNELFSAQGTPLNISGVFFTSFVIQ